MDCTYLSLPQYDIYKAKQHQPMSTLSDDNPPGITWRIVLSKESSQYHQTEEKNALKTILLTHGLSLNCVIQEACTEGAAIRSRSSRVSFTHSGVVNKILSAKVNHRQRCRDNSVASHVNTVTHELTHKTQYFCKSHSQINVSDLF